MNNLQASHDEKTKRISEKIAAAFKNQKHLYIFHGSSNTTREINFQKQAIIDVSDLDEVLEINTHEKYAIVEPNVSMEKLVSTTLEKGFIPPVVMEFPKITVGGGIQGGAGESSSFKWGLFHNLCEEYEIVLGNGQIAQVSRSNNPDLFWGLAGSYGSLAIITKVKLKLIEASKFVRLSYVPINSAAEAIELIKAESINQKSDFLDAILFSQNSGVIMKGEVVHASDRTPISFSKPSDEWFYLHVKEKIKNADFSSDIIELPEYLFRYNRGAFWVGKFFFNYFKLPFLKFTRKLFNEWLKAKNLYRLIHTTNKSQMFLVQDFCLPHNKVGELINYVDRHLNAYPLWICPLAPSAEQDKLSPNNLVTDLVFNIGIYTKIGSNYKKFHKLNRDLENLVKNLGGKKVLYAHQFYSEEEFWQIYDQAWYKNLRTTAYSERVFPDMYAKTFSGKKYKTRIIKGAFELLTFSEPIKVKDK